MNDFSGFGAFAAHLMMIQETEALTLRAGLEESAKLIEVAAKEELGVYQRSNMGPFDDWEELHDSTKKDRVYQGYPENEPGLRSGAMRESITHIHELITQDGDTMEAVVGSTDDHLVYFELGTEKQAPRSVLGVAAIRSEDKIQEIIGEAAIKAFAQ